MHQNFKNNVIQTWQFFDYFIITARIYYIINIKITITYVITATLCQSKWFKM